MSNTILCTGKFIEITGLDADFAWTDLPPHLVPNPTIGIMVKSIAAILSAATDRLIIREAGIDGATIYDTGVLGSGAPTETRVRYGSDNGTMMRPVIDITDCTIGTAANCKVLIEIA